MPYTQSAVAEVAELVDARDSKSRGGNTVSVRLRPSAPKCSQHHKCPRHQSAQENKMSDCIFCKIISREIPSEIVDENEHVIVFKDLNPKAPIHYLIVPKIHITNINEVDDTDQHSAAMREMFKMIRKLGKKLPEPKAFTLVSNNGKQAGQCVFHMHWHFLSWNDSTCRGKKSPGGINL